MLTPRLPIEDWNRLEQDSRLELGEYQADPDEEQINTLTLPMLRLLSSKAQRRKYFWKPSEPCLVGTHWNALAECSHMSTHLPGFQSFSGFSHHFVLSKFAASSIQVKLTINIRRMGNWQNLKSKGCCLSLRYDSQFLIHVLPAQTVYGFHFHIFLGFHIHIYLVTIHHKPCFQSFLYSVSFIVFSFIDHWLRVYKPNERLACTLEVPAFP